MILSRSVYVCFELSNIFRVGKAEKMWGKEVKFASRLEFHTIGFRDEIGEPCRCFLNSANRDKKKGKRGKKEEKKKGERGQRC